LSRARAILGSFAFFLLASGLIAGLIPWWLTEWELREPLQYWSLFRLCGAALVVAGVAVLVHAFARFALEGLGTPAPVAPTERLVVSGAYRFVRNPMYIAVLATIAGQALVFGRAALLLYGAVVLVAFAAFVHWYEEPTLRRQFGERYEEYRREVPGWWPRRRPWQSPGPG
jgi:protein-S-isoprenylcysteine O-methyltransferase Ste14